MRSVTESFNGSHLPELWDGSNRHGDLATATAQKLAQAELAAAQAREGHVSPCVITYQLPGQDIKTIALETDYAGIWCAFCDALGGAEQLAKAHITNLESLASLDSPYSVAFMRLMPGSPGFGVDGNSPTLISNLVDMYKTVR